MEGRLNISSGTKWEDVVGYSRAVRIGNVIEVSGTVAVEGDKIISENDAYGQTKYILEKIGKVIEETGGSILDVVRTRMFVTDISKWQDIGKAHGEFFKDIKPVTTMVEVSSLISLGLLVEIEATAIIN